MRTWWRLQIAWLIVCKARYGEWTFSEGRPILQRDWSPYEWTLKRSALLGVSISLRDVTNMKMYIINSIRSDLKAGLGQSCNSSAVGWGFGYNPQLFCSPVYLCISNLMFQMSKYVVIVKIILYVKIAQSSNRYGVYLKKMIGVTTAGCLQIKCLPCCFLWAKFLSCVLRI